MVTSNISSYLCVYVYVFGCVQVCVWRSLPAYVLRQGLPQHQDLIISARLDGQWAVAVHPFLPWPALRWLTCTTFTNMSICVGSGNSNPVLHAYAASAIPAKPSDQSLSHFYRGLFKVGMPTEEVNTGHYGQTKDGVKQWASILDVKGASTLVSLSRNCWTCEVQEIWVVSPASLC